MSARFDTPIERRRILKGFLVAGPTLAIAARVGLDGSRPDAAGAHFGSPEVRDVQDFTDIFLLTAQPFYYDLLIDIKPDNRVYFEIPRQEVGQGIMTAIPMMLADNLDVRVEDIDVALSKAEPHRGPGQLTGGSHSVRSLWDPIRTITAEMRARLATAGADHLGVSPHSVRTEDGHVIARDGRRVSYGEITAAAATATPKVAPHIKRPDEWKLIGKPRVRHNAREIATGQTPLFATDREGYLPTVIALPATHGAAAVSVDDSEAMKIPGVIAVTTIPGYPEALIQGGVAVTAETFGIAKKAKDALRIQWSAGSMDHLSDSQLDDLMTSIIDPVTAPDTGEGMVDAQFRWPYLPHAPMEANNCLADVTGDRAELIGAAKIPNTAVRNIATVLGMEESQVTLHCVPGGGSFGRRLFHDPHLQAAQISQQLGRPIKLQYMREEDIKHGRCRPLSLHHIRATVKGGDFATFEHRYAGPELDLRHGLGDIISHQLTKYNNAGVSAYFFTHTQGFPYKTGATAITLKEQLLAKPTSPWQVVYSGQVMTLNEIVVDEMARLLGEDELEFRLRTLDNERAKRVVERVAHEGEWGRKLPDGVAQGLGMHIEYKSFCAYLMELDTRGAEPRLSRMTIATDTGLNINPTGTASVMMGQGITGYATAMMAGLHIDSGATRESNFHDFKWPRMQHSPPEVKHVLLPNNQAVPGGTGELGIPAAAAATANAWARATGKTVRNFPILEHGA